MSKILIADTWEALLGQMRLGFALRSFEVHTAQTGSATLEAVQQASLAGVPFQIIVATIDIPRLSGLDVLRCLRDRGDSTPFIGLCDTQWPELVAAFRVLPDALLLEKPLCFRRLASRVDDLLNKIRTYSAPTTPSRNPHSL